MATVAKKDITDTNKDTNKQTELEQNDEPPVKKFQFEPVKIGPVSTLDEMNTKVLQFQNKKLTQNQLKRKTCFVPGCTNTGLKNPEKIFIHVPRKMKERKLWFEAAKRNMTSLQCFACEDHFNIQEDLESYQRYKIMGGRARLKPGILPRFFDCHTNKSQDELLNIKFDEDACSETEETNSTISDKEVVNNNKCDVEENKKSSEDNITNNNENEDNDGSLKNTESKNTETIEETHKPKTTVEFIPKKRRGRPRLNKNKNSPTRTVNGNFVRETKKQFAKTTEISVQCDINYVNRKKQRTIRSKAVQATKVMVDRATSPSYYFVAPVIDKLEFVPEIVYSDEEN